MVSTAAQKRAVIKYEKKNIVQLSLKLNKNTDMDIIEYLETVESKSGFIKECIRKCME